MFCLRSILTNGRSFSGLVVDGRNGIKRAVSSRSRFSCERSDNTRERDSTIRSQTHVRRLHSVPASSQQARLDAKVSISNSASLSPDGDFLVLYGPRTGSGGLRYPTVWLRDNCQCSRCFNPALNSRTIDWQTFDVNVRPTEVRVNGDFVEVVWSDSHLSSYDVDWLKNRSFEPDAQQRWLNEAYRPVKRPWTSRDFHEICKRFSFDDVLNSDDHLLSWLEAIAVNGVALIEGAPTKPDQNRILASRVAFIKKTHYGEEFIVKGKIGTSNLAYLPLPLQVHTDLPYYEYKPGLNLLHCLVQTEGEGGENQLTDCLNVADILRTRDPAAYEALTATLVEWDDIGQDAEGRFYSLYRSPVLCLDRTGQLERVNYSQQQRSSHFKVALEKVAPWYRAHKVFTDLLHEPNNTVFFKTKPGEILTFDNIRLVHGRTGYADVEGNERHLVGVYVDWDIAYSKIRTLRRDKDPGRYL